MHIVNVNIKKVKVTFDYVNTNIEYVRKEIFFKKRYCTKVNNYSDYHCYVFIID